MEDFDENGWTRMHHAAYKGIILNIDKYFEFDNNQLELETNDELHSTPLHLAIMGDNLLSIKHLISLGAKIHKRNSQGHGIVELACLRKSLSGLFYFLKEIDQNDFPTWKQLINFLGSDNDNEVERAAFCLEALLSLNENPNISPSSIIDNGINVLWKPAIENNFISTSIKVLSKDISIDIKSKIIRALISVLRGVSQARLQFGIHYVSKSPQNLETLSGFKVVMNLLQEISDLKDKFDILVLTDLVEIIYLIVKNSKYDVVSIPESNPHLAEEFVHELLKSKILLQLIIIFQKTPDKFVEDKSDTDLVAEISDFDENFVETQKIEISTDLKVKSNQRELNWLRLWRQVVLALTAFNDFDKTAQLAVSREEKLFEMISIFMNLNTGISKDSPSFNSLSPIDKVLVMSRGYVRKNFWLSILDSIKKLCILQNDSSSSTFQKPTSDPDDLLNLPQTFLQNQKLIIEYQISNRLIEFARLKSPDLQLGAVECLYYVGANNNDVQNVLRENCVFVPLLSILKKGLNTSENLAAAEEKEAGDELQAGDGFGDGKTVISSQFTLDEDELKSIGGFSTQNSRKTSLSNKIRRSTIRSSLTNKKQDDVPKNSPENLLIREKVMRTIWTLAGDDNDIRKTVANVIDVRMLIEFLECSSKVLQLIGAEALGELALSNERKEIEFKPDVVINEEDFGEEPLSSRMNLSNSQVTFHKELSHREIIGQKGGVNSLVNLLRSPYEQIVREACKTLATLCVDVGYVCVPVNQYRIAAKPLGGKTESLTNDFILPISGSGSQATLGYSGLRLFIALLLHAESKKIRCEAGHSLAMTLLGRVDLQQELMGQPGSKAEEIWDAILAQLLYLVHTDLQNAPRNETGAENREDDDDNEYALAVKTSYLKEALYLRLRAAEALTILAYEGTTQISKIAMLGGLRFKILAEICRPELFSSNKKWCEFLNNHTEPHHKCMAAFQIVILSRIMPDQEVVDSTSLALESLMDVIKLCCDKKSEDNQIKGVKKQKEPLCIKSGVSNFSRARSFLAEKLKTEWNEVNQDNKNTNTLKMALDCVARLCKSRPGIPEGLRCLGVCPYLAKCLRHPRESVRRAAAVSIAFIIKLPEAQREITHCFRIDPFLMKSLQTNTKDMKLNSDFLDLWDHCRMIGLPKSKPLKKTEQSKINELSVDIQTDLRGRPLSICTQLTGSVNWNNAAE